MEIPATRQILLKSVHPNSYQTMSRDGVLSNVGAVCEIVFEGKPKMFWITDIIPIVMDADGNNYLLQGSNKDDIRVHISVNGLELTDEPMPIEALVPKDEYKDLYSGIILHSNNRLTFRFSASKYKNNAGTPKAVYPLFVGITLKGYEVKIEG